MMCEKCWSDAYLRAASTNTSQADEYRKLLEERKDRPCSPREQAGQWWDDERQCDSRAGRGVMVEISKLIMEITALVRSLLCGVGDPATMTPDELRRIDAMAAEHVAGFAVGPDAYITGLMMASDGVAPLPPYTTSIADAWTLVEKMRSEGWKFWIDDVGTKWKATFYPGDQRGKGECESAPLAICLAALHAVGVDVQEVKGE